MQIELVSARVSKPTDFVSAHTFFSRRDVLIYEGMQGGVKTMFDRELYCVMNKMAMLGASIDKSE